MYLGLIYSGHLNDKKETKVPITSFLFGLIRYKDSSKARDPKDRKSHREIISRPNLLSGSEFHSIHLNPP